MTKEIRGRLVANSRLRRQLDGTDAEADFLPVVKLFTPDAGTTVLLTEVDPDEPDIAFGLCGLGLDCPELEYASLAEIADVRGRFAASCRARPDLRGQSPHLGVRRRGAHCGPGHSVRWQPERPTLCL